MTIRVPLIAGLFCIANVVVFGQQQQAQPPRSITLPEALDLALQNNHRVREARLEVDEKQRARDMARSGYFPVVHTDGSVLHVTNTQLVEIPAGSLGIVGDYQIPPRPLILNQGAFSMTTFAAGITQPLTQLLKVSAANGVARADVEASVNKTRAVENAIALKVHQIYYEILIADTRRGALQARIQASEGLQGERVQQVTYGSALNADLIESRAQTLQARQDLLTMELRLSDLHMQFNDVIGLPLTAAIAPDPNVAVAVQERCTLNECVRLAMDWHPEITEARAQVEKAASAVRLAKYDFVPDVDAFGRYSHQNGVPFLASNSAMFGIRLSYDVFNGGRKRAMLAEQEAQLARARENLARISDDVQLRVQTAYDTLERTGQMIAVSDELVSLRAESRRMTIEQVSHGSALRSQSLTSVAQELEAKAGSLESQLNYLQAAAELDDAIGRTPR